MLNSLFIFLVIKKKKKKLVNLLQVTSGSLLFDEASTVERKKGKEVKDCSFGRSFGARPALGGEVPL